MHLPKLCSGDVTAGCLWVIPGDTPKVWIHPEGSSARVPVTALTLPSSSTWTFVPCCVPAPSPCGFVQTLSATALIQVPELQAEPQPAVLSWQGKVGQTSGDMRAAAAMATAATACPAKPFRSVRLQRMLHA